jgi:hypothetical protein
MSITYLHPEVHHTRCCSPDNTTNILPYLLESPYLTPKAVPIQWFLPALTQTHSTIVSSVSLLLNTTLHKTFYNQNGFKSPTTSLQTPVSLSGFTHCIRD